MDAIATRPWSQSSAFSVVRTGNRKGMRPLLPRLSYAIQVARFAQVCPGDRQVPGVSCGNGEGFANAAEAKAEQKRERNATR